MFPSDREVPGSIAGSDGTFLNLKIISQYVRTGLFCVPLPFIHILCLVSSEGRYPVFSIFLYVIHRNLKYRNIAIGGKREKLKE